MHRATMNNRLAHLLSTEPATMEPLTLPGNDPTSKPEHPHQEAETGPEDEDEEEVESDEDEEDEDTFEDDDDRSQGRGQGGGNNGGDGLGFDDGGDDDGDDDDDGLDDKALENELVREKLQIAKDGKSGLTEGRAIFIRDPNDKDRVYVVAAIEDILPSDEEGMIATDGSQMWMTDLIFRFKGRGYEDPKHSIRKINPEVFKKDNWASRTDGKIV